MTCAFWACSAKKKHFKIRFIVSCFSWTSPFCSVRSNWWIRSVGSKNLSTQCWPVRCIRAVLRYYAMPSKVFCPVDRNRCKSATATLWNTLIAFTHWKYHLLFHKLQLHRIPRLSISLISQMQPKDDYLYIYHLDDYYVLELSRLLPAYLFCHIIHHVQA